MNKQKLNLMETRLKRGEVKLFLKTNVITNKKEFYIYYIFNNYMSKISPETAKIWYDLGIELYACDEYDVYNTLKDELSKYE